MPARLSISQPSPATVLFTISNAPTRDTLLAKLIFYLGVLLRIFSFITVLLIDIAKLYDLEVYNGTGSLASLLSTRLGALAYRIAHGYSLQVIAVSSCVVLYLATRKGYTEESLLVLRGLGVQTSTSSLIYFMPAVTRFIPATRIQDIVIHEAFRGFEVRFYLAIIVEGESEVVVVFPNLLPRRLILEEVWKGSRRCLYDPSP